jgi:uncharacterized delta-60 repeat protein
MISKLLLTGIIMTSVCVSSIAQVTELDPDFANAGIQIIDVNESNNVARDIIQLEDGKILLAGHVATSTQDNYCIVRLLEDGSVDLSFGNGGIVITNFEYGSIANEIAISEDGKILVAGHTWSGVSNHFALARYQSDGILDVSFGENGLVSTPFSGKNAIGTCIAIQEDEKIVLGGFVYTLENDFDEFALARYLPNGNLDETFGTNGQLTTHFNANSWDRINSIALQNDQKIIAAGFSSSQMALARYNPDGSLDTSFSSDGLLQNSLPNSEGSVINAIIIDENGSIYGGGFTVDEFSNFNIVRYTPNGNVDETFADNGYFILEASQTSDGIDDIAFLADGSIMFGGTVFEDNISLYGFGRISATGELDMQIGDNGIVTYQLSGPQNFLESIFIQEDGKILAAGSAKEYPSDMGILRLTEPNLDTEELDSKNSVLCFPNPAQDQLNISVPNSQDLKIKVFNSLGQQLFPSIKSITRYESKDLLNVDISSFSSGIYYIEFSGFETPTIALFIKEAN